MSIYYRMDKHTTVVKAEGGGVLEDKICTHGEYPTFYAQSQQNIPNKHLI